MVSQRNLKKVLQNERREENNDQQTKFLVIKVLSINKIISKKDTSRQTKPFHEIKYISASKQTYFCDKQGPADSFVI